MHNVGTMQNMSHKIGNLLSQYRPLLLILLGYTLFGGVHTWLVPPFEGPDEAQHFAYITWLAEGKGFPPQGDAAWDTPIEQEGGQPPLYYLCNEYPV